MGPILRIRRFALPPTRRGAYGSRHDVVLGSHAVHLARREDQLAVIAAMPLEIWDIRYLTDGQARSIGELIHATWPKPHMTPAARAAQQLEIGRQYAHAGVHEPRAIVIVEGDAVVAHASVLPRTVGTERGDMTIAGLARVCTAAAARGRGLGEAVVRAALGLVDAGEFEFALFQTNGRVRGFYERLGCVPVENLIVNSLAEDPMAAVFWDEVAMRYPVHGDWPAGTIDLRGPGY